MTPSRSSHADTDTRPDCTPGLPNPRAFTLIELVLVMGLLAMVLAVGAPSLARFFQGRHLDSEARRFLGLTRYAQSRAVSEGMPMMLWIDPQQRVYGLRAESSYTDQDSRAIEFTLADDLQIEADTPNPATSYDLPWEQTRRVSLTENRPTIRFAPDGSIGPTSPEHVSIRHDSLGTAWIGQNRTRLYYEIQTNPPPTLR